MNMDQMDPIKMDYVDPANALNMPGKADMTFAMDFLIRAKEGVRNTAVALTETVSPDARALLQIHAVKACLPAHRTSLWEEIKHEGCHVSRDQERCSKGCTGSED